MRNMEFIKDGEKLIIESMWRIDEGDKEFKRIQEHLKKMENKNGRDVILSAVYRSLVNSPHLETFESLFKEENYIKDTEYLHISKESLEEKLKYLDSEYVVLEKTIETSLEAIDGWQTHLRELRHTDSEIDDFYNRYGEVNDSRVNYKKYLHDKSLLLDKNLY